MTRHEQSYAHHGRAGRLRVKCHSYRARLCGLAPGNNTCPFEVLNWFWCHWSAQPMTPKVNSVTAGSLTRKAPGRFRRAIFRVRLPAGRNQRGAGSNIHSTQAGREASCAGPGNGGRGPPGRLGTVRLRAGTSSSEISANQIVRIVAPLQDGTTFRDQTTNQ